MSYAEFVLLVNSPGVLGLLFVVVFVLTLGVFVFVDRMRGR